MQCIYLGEKFCVAGEAIVPPYNDKSTFCKNDKFVECIRYTEYNRIKTIHVIYN